MWASQVWSSRPRQACPEGTEQRAALITQGSCCHIVIVRHPVPRCHAVLSPPAASAMTTQTMVPLAQQMQRECPVKHGKLNQSHCLCDSLFGSSCLLSAVLSVKRVFTKEASGGMKDRICNCGVSPVSRVALGAIHLVQQVHEMRPTLRDSYMRWSGIWEAVSSKIVNLWTRDWKTWSRGNFFLPVIQQTAS